MTASSSAGRMILVMVALLCGLQVQQAEHQLMMAILISLALALAVLGAVGRLGPLASVIGRIPPRRTARAVVVVSGAIACSQVAIRLPAGRAPVVAPLVGLGLLALVVLAAWTTEGRHGTTTFMVMLGAISAVMVVVIHTISSDIDVRLFLEGGARDLLHFHSPYGGTTPNPYTPAQSREFWAPEALDGDRILYGMPYLPGTLVPVVLGYVLSDVRLGTLACAVLAAVLLRRTCSDEVGRIVALLAVLSPLMVPVVTGYWVEPAFAVFLVVGVLGLRERRPALAMVGIGLLLASKQYLVVALPVLFVVRRKANLTVAAGAVGVASAVCLPFLLIGPSDFIRDTVTAQLAQPFRSDSISLMVALGNTVGEPPSWLTALLPLTAGLLVSVALARWSPLDPATLLALTVGLSLLATVLLSKQAFGNYFYLVQASLVVAAAVWSGSGDDGKPGQREAHQASSRARAASGSIGPSSRRSSSRNA